MNMILMIIIAAAAAVGNAVFWYRKGVKTGDLQSQKNVTEFVEKKRDFEVSLNEAADFAEFMEKMGRDPSYPFLVLDIDRWDWNGRTE